MPEFKVGDRVYCPVTGVGLYAVGAVLGAAFYHLSVCGVAFTADGRPTRSAVHPVIFHATPENQAALESLYGVKFDDAPKPVPVGSDLTRWLLKKHGKPVLCYVDTHSDGQAVTVAFITAVDGTDFFVSTSLGLWRYAVPIDNATGFTTAADYVTD